MQQQEPQPASTPEFDRLAVVTIQGGGIYGLNLLGQLGYLTERYKIVPVAVAGNSAGAIVATLYWAGYPPWKIRNAFVDMASNPFDNNKKRSRFTLRKYDPKNASNLCQLIDPVEPEKGRLTLDDFRSLKNDCEWFVSKHLGEETKTTWFGRRWEEFRTFDRVIRSMFTLRRIRNRIAEIFASRGCFEGDAFIKKIDELIRNGPMFVDRNDLPVDRLIEFADVWKIVAKDPKFNPPALFLTATNVTKRKLEVFNSIDPEYDHVPIAKAVRASAGFPVFFRPVEFNDDRYAGWYADGGIVSNYPSWIFSQAFRIRMLECSAYRQLAMRPWVHFGLRLERSPITADPSSRDPKVYMSSLGRMLLGGESRSELEERLEKQISHSYTIQQPSDKQLPPIENECGINVPEDLLDIDAISKPLVKEMYRLGREESRTPGPLGFSLPEKELIEPLLHQLIDHVLLVFGHKDNNELRFRSNVFIPNEDQLFIRYSVNMEKPMPGEENKIWANNDHDLTLPFDAGLTGACLTTRRPLLCNLQKLGQSDKELRDGLFGMTETMHNKVRKDRTWLASVPIFDPLASFPRELSIPTKLELPHRTAYSNCMAGRLDGAVMGVLNLDASLDYDRIDPIVDPDPRIHWRDARIMATMELMASVANRIGELLSRNFARQV
jgi:predicted acylesterase/phospholipase RssA